MVPSRQVKGPNILVVGYDHGHDNSTAVVAAAMSQSTMGVIGYANYRPGTTTGFDNNYPYFTNCSTNYFRQAKRHCAYTLARTYGRLLTPSEKAFLREINAQPTREGKEACQERHNRALSRIETLPHLHARFDRRIPCWRAGRWKSLT